MTVMSAFNLICLSEAINIQVLAIIYEPEVPYRYAPAMCAVWKRRVEGRKGRKWESGARNRAASVSV